MSTTTDIYATLQNHGTRPFSSGPEGMDWQSNNCDQCIRSWCHRHPDQEPPQFSATEKQCETGQECWGAFAIGVGFVSGLIPRDTADWIGATISDCGRFARMPDQCRHFSTDQRDSPDYTPPPIDRSQLRIPFLCAELFGFTDPDILVLDKAIIHKEDFVTI